MNSIHHLSYQNIWWLWLEKLHTTLFVEIFARTKFRALRLRADFFSCTFHKSSNFGTHFRAISHKVLVKTRLFCTAFFQNVKFENFRADKFFAYLSQNFNISVLIFAQFRANRGPARKCAKICPRKNFYEQGKINQRRLCT